MAAQDTRFNRQFTVVNECDLFEPDLLILVQRASTLSRNSFARSLTSGCPSASNGFITQVRDVLLPSFLERIYKRLELVNVLRNHPAAFEWEIDVAEFLKWSRLRYNP